MGHLLYLMFRCDGDEMESLDFWGFFEGSKHTPIPLSFCECCVNDLTSTVYI